LNQPRLWAMNPRLRTIVVLLLAGTLALMATVPLDWKDQAILGVLLFVAALVAHRRSKSHQATGLLMVVSLFCTARYFWWRLSETGSYLILNGSQTHPLDIFFVLLLLGAEGYAVLILVLGYFQGARPLDRKPVPLPDDPATWPSVDVLIPTYNEPLDVIRATLLAALNMDWPKDRLKVYVLDDGKRSEVHALAEVCGAGIMVRLDNEGAKAGNINYALQRTHGEFVAVFDCDHVPTRSFLQMTMGWLVRQPRLAMVQTPHHFYSPDPFERNLGTFRSVPNEGDLFYGVVQNGSDFWNSSLFCGSCAVLRRQALNEIGGLATETVTEDSHTSLRLQRNGWHTAYMNLPQAAGLATANLADHIAQRIRWARGMVQVLRVERPLFARGLRFYQRLCYFNSAIHFLHATPRLIFLTAPLFYLLLGHSNLYGYVWAILAYVMPHMMLATLTNARVHGRHRHAFWNEVFETVLAPYILLPTLFALINPRWGKFNVTPKRALITQSYFDLRIASPFILLLLLNFGGLAAGFWQLRAGIDSQETVIVNMVWTTINTLIVGAALAVPWETRQRRTASRVSTRLPLRMLLPDGSEVEGVTLDLSTGGISAQLQRPCGLQMGDHAEIQVSASGRQFILPVRLARNSGLRIGLAFAPRGMEDHEAIARVLFGRADAWIQWSDGRQTVGTFRSLTRLLIIALKGILLVPKGLFSGPSGNEDLAREEPELTEHLPKRQAALPLLGFVLMGLLASSAVEAAEPFVEVRDLPALGQRQPVTLRGRDGRLNLSFGVPVTKIVRDASLALHFRESGGFIPDSSRLTISLNGAPVSSVPLSARQSENDQVKQLQIPLPSDLVVSENTLSIQLSANCPSGCRDSAHWVRIESTSLVRLTGSMLALANNIGLLPAPFFDPSVHRPLRIPLIFADTPDDATLEAAGVVASWFGVLADDRGIHFPVRMTLDQPGDGVLIAKRDSPIAATLGLNGQSGPVIALRENPADSYGKLLVLMGATSQEILEAARALALGQYARQGDQVRVSGVRLPPVVPSTAPRWLNPERMAGLGEGLNPEQLKVYGSGATNLYFRLPPDLAFGQRSTVPLRLAFRTTGVGTSQRAEIRVKLNGVQVAVTRATVSELPTLHRENIYLPVSALYPSNTLTVDFLFSPVKDAPPDRYPEAAVQAESAIDLRGIPRYVQLPRLDLFVKAGFPFTRFADLSGTAVVLPEAASAEEISLYLNLVARFAGQTGHPGLRVAVTRPSRLDRAAGKDILLIGSPEDQPMISRWASHMSVLFADGAVRAADQMGAWGGLAYLPLLSSVKERRRLSDVLTGNAKPEGILHGFSSPLDRRNSVVMLSAGERQTLQPMMAALAGENLGDVQGSLSLLENGRFQSFAVEKSSNYIGQLGWLETFYNWMASYFWAIAVLTVGCAVPLSRWFHEWADRAVVARLEGQR
jgi:cellulose synthase (UDP-forming)